MAESNVRSRVRSPPGTAKEFMFTVYVLLSESHQTRYVGSCLNVEIRLKEHNAGTSRYTSGRRPWKIIYTETFQSRTEARKRENFLKSGQGRKWMDENIL